MRKSDGPDQNICVAHSGLNLVGIGNCYRVVAPPGLLENRDGGMDAEIGAQMI